MGNRFVVSLLLILIFKKYTEHEFDGKKISRTNYTFWYLIFVLFFFSHTTRSWMFRHSDGNKNSWEREKANKAFLSIRHHRHHAGLHLLMKISEDICQQICFVFENILLWLHGCGSQNSGIPTELPWLTFASSHRQICPLLRICFSRYTFQHFWAEFVCISTTFCQKLLFFQLDSHFLMAGQARMLHNVWSLHPNISASTSRQQKPLAIHCNATVADDTNR